MSRTRGLAARKKRLSQPRAKRMVAKAKKAKAKKNMDTFFLKARYNGIISPAQGSLVSNYIYWTPSLFNTSDLTYIGNNSEFKLYQAQYDKVRINSIKVIVTPKANVFDQVAAQNDSAYTLTGDGMIHTAIDRDGKVPSNIAKIQRYPSYKAYSVMKKFSRTYRVTYPKGVWIDCQNLAPSAASIFTLGLEGSIGLYAENLVEDAFELINEPWADYQLEYNCVFQGKTSAGISVDNAGRIVLTPEAATPTYATQTAVNVRGSISGDKRYDLSGNLVAVTDTDLP